MTEPGPPAGLPHCMPPTTTRRRLLALPLPLALALLAAALLPLPAQADALQALKAFTREVQTARGSFTQTVVAPDGAKKRSSSGSFEFSRPNRFRFQYAKPFEQLIVGDGAKVWLHDVDLNQVTVRAQDQALGGTPAALLAGAALERDFDLAAQAPREGLDWVLATPKAKDGTVARVLVGFRGGVLATLEITDAFGQRSILQFTEVQTGLALPAERFRFSPPAGADVVGP